MPLLAWKPPMNPNLNGSLGRDGRSAGRPSRFTPMGTLTKGPLMCGRLTSTMKSEYAWAPISWRLATALRHIRYAKYGPMRGTRQVSFAAARAWVPSYSLYMHSVHLTGPGPEQGSAVGERSSIRRGQISQASWSHPITGRPCPRRVMRHCSPSGRVVL